ncbi:MULTISPECIES: ABC transporter permease [unclassified Treponema]|uniref:ABC transporter permease n=1 Tax=unclassified Treponema TaxID=2638727 RepID=UPI0020A32BE5|nr:MULTISPECIES: ABC transporter permease [unclassified Treponema]UTC66502.1 ABC transporter permease [Treponema sp. OMZ 789]UTC69234.1 ABC transporter permease [Treponema sp. OMZ 790]UTC71947.1 ABC transporter permease [Treponema sp. OMZ 791]
MNKIDSDCNNQIKELDLKPEDFIPVNRTKKTLQTTRVSIGFWEDVRRRFKKSKRALFSCIVLGLIILVCTFGPILSGYPDDEGNLKEKNMSPSSSHFFGTDELGRDIFTRVCKGGRASLLIAIIGTAIDISIGLIYGGISAYTGGKTDTVMMRIVEILSSVPYLITAILISLIFGKGIFSIIIAMTITGWCFTARLVRGQILQLKNQDFVLAAKALGTSPFKIIVKHLLPNTVSVMIIALTFDIPSFIFGEAFLSYIGLGIQPPYTSWGLLASEAQKTMLFYPYQLFFPALFISLTILSLQIIGDALRDAMDPHLRKNK